MQNQIAIENRVILNNISHPIGEYKEFWTPTFEDTEKALIKILEYLKNPKNYKSNFQKLEISKILENFYQYHVQFIGVEKNGEKIIHCNFFVAREEKKEWKELYFLVLDGGCNYWQIDYSIKEEECFNFRSNGYG